MPELKDLPGADDAVLIPPNQERFAWDVGKNSLV